MQVEKEAFAGVMEYYKLLPTSVKRSEIISEFEDIISNYSKICTKLNVIPNIILNKEMLNLNREDLSEEEFLHALFAYLNALQDISGQFINKMSSLLEDQKN